MVQGLPESLKGLKLTLLGDIQIDRYTQGKKIIDFQNKINKNQTDIIMFAGDLVTRGQHFIPQALDIICNMPENPHKIAVMGDHDYWANPHKISTGMKDCGWDFLQNQHQLIQYNGNRILVTGITNIYSRRINKSTFDRILSTAPESDFKILLTHQPSPNLVRLAASHGYNLFLGGHTHGGQIAFKPFGFTITMSMFETPFFSGQYQYQNMPVIVTNGIGLTLAAIRYNVPAEITLITLTSE